MNALNILLANNTIDCVVSNSILHLISRPEKVINEIYRDSICSTLFKKKEEIVVPIQVEYKNKLKDGFLPRFLGRGFSDQVDVPTNLHNEIVINTIEQIKKKHGEQFGELAFHGIEPDILMTIYKK